ncbi:alcohol dehydrogenase catalytic domain-containing protein [Lentzea miocenica]
MRVRSGRIPASPANHRPCETAPPRHRKDPHARSSDPRPGDVRVETLDDPKILHPTDAIIRTAVTCVCGSDLWPWRGLEPVGEAHPMGHEYVGFVEEVGSEVTSVAPGQFVVGSFATSDNTCANCRNGFQSNCLHREFMSTCQAEYVRIPNAQGPWSPPTRCPANSSGPVCWPCPT